MSLPRSRLTEVRAALRRDRARLREHYARHEVPAPGWLPLIPSYQCLVLHRLSHHCFRNRRRKLARLFWHLNLVLTGADISAISQLGPGAVIVHPMSTLIFGRAGADCTFWGHCGIGGGRTNEDIGAGAGLPIVGDRVAFGARSIVLGPVRIGDDCVIGPGCIVMRDVAAGSRVELDERQIAVRNAA